MIFYVYFRNDDEELVGFNYNMMNLLCKVINKKCEHIGYHSDTYSWDENKMSIGGAIPYKINQIINYI